MTLQSAFERALLEGEADAFDFVLAEALGMTLADIGRMSNHEYLRWRAFYTYRDAMREMNAQPRR